MWFIEPVDFPTNPKQKPGFQLEFCDDFLGDTLDQSKWFPYMLPHWSKLEDSAARFDVGGGSLKLRIDEDQGIWLGGSDRASNVQTGHWSGAKDSRVGQFGFYPNPIVKTELPNLRLYTPQCGYFETRIKAVPVVGYHVALWMVGFDAPQAGEIRVFEIHGGNVGPNGSRIDCGILAWDDPDLHDECFEDWLEINAAEHHVYALEWTPTHTHFFVDNQKIRSVAQSPQYPMQFMLGVYERPHELRVEDRDIPFPRVCEVDFFRGYQPNQGYGPQETR